MEKTKILIPTDFSVQAEYAYIMVKKLEEKINAEIHFLNVLPLPDTVSLNAEGKIETCGEIDVNFVETQVSIARRNLENLKNNYRSDLKVHLKFGKITDTIIRFAEEENFNLIVMGTKGAFGIKEKLSGSETQFVTRNSKVPVLSLMCDRSDLSIESILLIHNFNHPKNENLTLMKKIASAFQVKLHFLQISNNSNTEDVENIKINMEKFAELNEIQKYECHVIEDKNVEQGVVHFNQMHNMDLICIGTHGKGSLFHSSATEKLVNHLFKPIITFHLK